MSKINFNNEQFNLIYNKISDAQQKMSDALNECQKKISDNPIDEGFINLLYNEAELNFMNNVGIGYNVTTLNEFAYSSNPGCCVPENTQRQPITGIDYGVLYELFAMPNPDKAYKYRVADPKNIKWSVTAKDSFLNFIKDCNSGNVAPLARCKNITYKLNSVLKSLDAVKEKINEYNAQFADLKDAADELGVKTILADDGITLLGVETTININGTDVKMSVSEAMNAYYTYMGTAVNSRIEAEYMKNAYGVDINYIDLMKSPNGFMVNSIESGLYSHELISTILPAYNPDDSLTYSVVAGGLGVTTSQFHSILSNNLELFGQSALGPSLVGASYIGKVSIPSGDTGVVTPPVEEKKDDIVEINEIDNDTLKLKEEIDGFEFEKDYDELARIEFESKGEEAIMQDRISIIQTANTLFDSPDKGALRSNLEQMGYSSEEIDVIITNREYTISAFVEGYQRKELANIAENLAIRDGVRDYDTKYDDGQLFSDLTDGKSAQLTAIISSDGNVKNAQTAMLESQKDCKIAIDEMKDAYTDYETSKANVDSIKCEIIKTSGEDMSKWSQEDIVKYNDAVKDCNSKLTDITEKTNAAKTAIDNYKKANEDYISAKNNFFTNSGKFVSQEFDNPLNSESGTTGDGQGENGLTNQGQGQGNGVLENDLSGLKIGPNGITIE